MGLRFTKDTTRNAQQMSGLMDKWIGKYEDYQAGEAYKDAAQQQERRGLGAETTKVDPSQYTYDSDTGTYVPSLQAVQSGASQYLDGSEAGKGIMPTFAEGQKQYGIGANPESWQDTAPTRGQRHVAGLQGQMERLSGLGRAEEAGKLGERIAPMEKLERERTAYDNFQRDVKDKAAFIKKHFDADVIGREDMKGKKVEYMPTKDGTVAVVTNEDGTVVPGTARHYNNDEIDKQAFQTYLQVTDPAKAYAARQHDKERAEDKEERGLTRADAKETRADTLGHQKEVLAVTKQHYEDMRIKYEADAKRLSAQMGSRFAPQIFNTENGPVIYNPNSDKWTRNGKPVPDSEVNKLMKPGTEKARAEDPVRDALVKGISTGNHTVEDVAAYDRLKVARGGGLLPPKAAGGAAAPASAAPPPAAAANPSGLPSYLPQGGATPVPLPEGMDNPDAWRAFFRGGLYGPGGLSGR